MQIIFWLNQRITMINKFDLFGTETDSPFSPEPSEGTIVGEGTGNGTDIDLFSVSITTTQPDGVVDDFYVINNGDWDA